MKKFIIKSFVCFFVYFSIIYFILEFADRGLKNERLGSVKKGIQTDVLILGTSRAYRHFDTDQLEELEGKKFFNLGLDASGFKSQKALLEYYLKYNDYPKEIIWEYNFGFLNEEEAIYEFEFLLPIADEGNIFDLLLQYDLLSNKIKIFKGLRYIGFNKIIYKGLMNLINPKPYLKYKVQDISWDSYDFNKKYLQGGYSYEKEISQKSLDDFLIILQNLRNHRVNVSMVFTPMYSGVFLKKDQKKEILNYYDSLFNIESLKRMNFLYSDISNDTLNFYNVLHMNKIGVNKFTKEFSKVY